MEQSDPHEVCICETKWACDKCDACTQAFVTFRSTVMKLFWRPVASFSKEVRGITFIWKRESDEEPQFPALYVQTPSAPLRPYYCLPCEALIDSSVCLHDLGKYEESQQV